MLDWMKGVMGRKGAPLQKLIEASWKDEPEKQALLTAIATDDSVRGEMLVPLLGAADAAVQQRATALFLSRADESAVAALFHRTGEVEGAAAKALHVKLLGRSKPELVTAVVDGALKVKDADRVRTAWGVLLELPPEMSDAYLMRAIDTGPPPARLTALERLLKKGDIEGLRPQLLALATDRDARVRTKAVDALMTLTGNDVFEAMLDRLSGDDNAEIRAAAGKYLQKFIVSAPADMRPTILGRLLLAGDPDLQATLLKALFSTGAMGALLLEILTFCKTILGVQHATVLTALRTLGDPLLDATLPLLAHEDADIRVQALLVVEKYAQPRTVAAIVKLLGDPDFWVRIMACETLGRLKDPRTLGYLEKMLSDSDAKWAAIDAIGTIGGEQAYTTLAVLLRDAQSEVRLAGTNAIARVQDHRVLPAIEEVAKADPAIDVRIRAIELVREARGGGASGEGGGATITSAKIAAPMDKLLAYARESGASDLHITPGEPPILRVNGTLMRVPSKALPPVQTEALLNDILDSVRRPILERVGAVDFCYSVAGVGRYRANVFRQQRGMSGAFRCIPNVAPVLADLGLPKHLDEVNTYHQGIVLLTGPAGSGKSTSLSALVNVINESRQAHVLTLEDPIEFVHPPKKALINQREIGRDSMSFAAAMRAALREDPDVVVVGEMRDRETIRLALLAAETGHLVIATMQTTGATATVDKLVESFPTDEQQQVRVSLSGSLKLIVSQTLVPRADAPGRIGVFEILKSTSPIRTIIREGKTFQLGSAMQIGRSQGMQTVDASLEELLNAGKISIDTALENAEKRETFEKLVGGGKKGLAAHGEGAAATNAAPAIAKPPSIPPPDPNAKAAVHAPLKPIPKAEPAAAAPSPGIAKHPPAPAHAPAAAAGVAQPPPVAQPRVAPAAAPAHGAPMPQPQAMQAPLPPIQQPLQPVAGRPVPAAAAAPPPLHAPVIEPPIMEPAEPPPGARPVATGPKKFSRARITVK